MKWAMAKAAWAAGGVNGAEVAVVYAVGDVS